MFACKYVGRRRTAESNFRARMIDCKYFPCRLERKNLLGLAFPEDMLLFLKKSFCCSYILESFRCYVCFFYSWRKNDKLL